MNILFTSVGRRSYLVRYFKEALAGDGEIHVANSSAISPAFLEADHSVVTPLIYNEEYIPFLLKYCSQNNIHAVISLFDIDLSVLAKNKNRFEAIGTRVIVSNPEVINICEDKEVAARFLESHKILTPKTYSSLDEAEAALDSGEIHFPVMTKPRWGMGSIGVFEAENREELHILYEKTKRSIQHSYLKYESEMDIGHCVLIQEKLNGQEYGLDVINDLDGNYVTTISKLKYAMRSGETDCAVTVPSHELKNLGKKLSSILHHVANLDVDIFEVKGQYYVLEMNARFGGGYPFSHLAGVNLPLAIIKWLKSEDVCTDILQEKMYVMGQKDITLVQLPFTEKYL